MDIDLVGTWAEAEYVDLRGCTAVVIDVLRASSTIVAALAAGAGRVVPVETVQEGLDYARRVGRENVVLGGERDAVRIDGYDLGNSPLEYTAEAVRGRPVVLTTTNGTQAVARCRDAEAIIVAALNNATAVVSWLARRRQDVAIVCAGTEGRISLDDVHCGGLLIARLFEPEFVRQMSDGARMAMEWYVANAGAASFVIHSCFHGRRLIDRGFGDDVDVCAQIDRYDIVPAWDGEGFVADAAPRQ